VTKKDYRAIARALYGSALMDTGAERDQWEACIGAVAEALQTDNPRFDRARFIEACVTGHDRCRCGRPGCHERRPARG